MDAKRRDASYPCLDYHTILVVVIFTVPYPSLFFLFVVAVDAPPIEPIEGAADPIPLPDIRDQLKRKELQEKIAQMEADEEAKKVKIKRSDKEAFTKVRVMLAWFLKQWEVSMML